jgi:putative ABC transport system permease protein
VRERTSELGVLKTLGFTDTGVLLMVLAESVLLALLAGSLGLAAVFLLAPGIRPMVEMFMPVFYVPPRSLAYGLALAVLLGLASGGLPAWSAMRLQIVEALRRR